MKVSGFTFIKNGIIYDYPIEEAIRSILPICDEVVVAVGQSDDDTLNFIKNIDADKIKIIETVWDESQREGGKVLALETNKAFAEISEESDWAFYIQGDEVVHEKYLDTIYDAMKLCKNNEEIDGLLFNYKHFYGSYDYIGSSENWYKHEIRVVKNDKSIYSYRDAQGFRKGDNQKLNVHPIDAYIYHYGWVKPPEAMQRKQEKFQSYWHDDKWMEENIPNVDEFDYNKNISELSLFQESHPKVMQKRVATRNWKFEYDISYNKRKFKDKLKKFLRDYFGIDSSYKNYIVKKIK
jgi:hypothetical protein